MPDCLYCSKPLIYIAKLGWYHQEGQLLHCGSGIKTKLGWPAVATPDWAKEGKKAGHLRSPRARHDPYKP